MIWLWTTALGATLVGLVVARRGLARADAAVVRLQTAADSVQTLPGAVVVLDRATGEAALQRAALTARGTPVI